MQKPILVIIFSLLCSAIHSQEKNFSRNIMAGVYYGLGKNQPIRLTRKYITEDVGPFHGEMSWSAGVRISGMVSRKIRLEIAMDYSKHDGGFELSPPIYPESTIYPESLEIINIPITLRWYFRNIFFVSGGTMIGIEMPRDSYRIDRQSGFGFTAGAGTEIHIKNFEIDVTPNIEIHSVIPFTAVKYQQRLLVAGLKIGFGYRFSSAADSQGQNDEN